MIFILALAGMAILALMFLRSSEGGRMAALVWLSGCALALFLGLTAVAVAISAFRGVATPLAEVMAAADAVAEGDLSARVGSHAPGDFGRLADSFNHMAEELERADQQRRNLTADVAHELRTPLHIVQGNLEGVLDGVYEPSFEHITATLEETRSLTRLVDDLQTLSLAEADQLPMSWEAVDVGELLVDVHTSFSGQAEAAGIELSLELADPLPRVTGDVGRLDQVLGNLMANAIRHTPSGRTITLRAEPIDEHVSIQVDDTGEGIPAADLPFIFQRFWRGDRSRSHAGGVGSGLGLVIARQLVQMHNGQIWVESELGKGTSVTINLPIKQDHA
jgi:two-component system OmpR family sensor kinase/two-component system sensor histidine kinase BaeS